MGFVRQQDEKDHVFWILLAVGVAGPVCWVVVQMSGVWQTGLSTALWVTVAASMALFFLLSAITRQAWRLAPLMVPYLLGLAVLAFIWQAVPSQPLLKSPSLWVEVHIFVSVITYGLVTIAAVAALAAFLRERAIQNKKPTALTHRLPSVADCESILVRLLLAGEIVLFLGLATGMATLYQAENIWFSFDHKTILTVASFLVIGGLLVAHFRQGMRGRRAARLVLLAYLLLTLGYPGVKFVTDILLG